MTSSSVPVPDRTAVLLALADQRLPSGGHIHSGGIEQAVEAGLVRDTATLRGFLHRRLCSAGRVAAAVTAAAVTLGAADVAGLDAETDARLPSPAQRAASRSQGRGLLRLARAAWAAPHPGLAWADLGPRPHHPVVLGCAARAAGADAAGAALVAAYLSIAGPATAAQRLLALDPVAVASVTFSLSDELAAVAAGAAPGPGTWANLADDGDPLLDLLAEQHAARAGTLFAS
ncbi:MAG TPA: urease accessory UreF family protein [Kineosporiaceae bacterium]